MSGETTLPGPLRPPACLTTTAGGRQRTGGSSVNTASHLRLVLFLLRVPQDLVAEMESPGPLETLAPLALLAPLVPLALVE